MNRILYLNIIRSGTFLHKNVFSVTVAHTRYTSLPPVPFRMKIIVIICDSLNESIYAI